MKLVTKVNCERCHTVKEYLSGRGISYEEIYIEKPEQLDVYRKMLTDNDRPLGFPIILNGAEIVNGNTEEIITFIESKYPIPQSDRHIDTDTTEKQEKTDIYFWGR